MLGRKSQDSGIPADEHGDKDGILAGTRGLVDYLRYGASHFALWGRQFGSLLLGFADFASSCVFVSHRNMMTQFSESEKFPICRLDSDRPM